MQSGWYQCRDVSQVIAPWKPLETEISHKTHARPQMSCECAHTPAAPNVQICPLWLTGMYGVYGLYGCKSAWKGTHVEISGSHSILYHGGGGVQAEICSGTYLWGKCAIFLTLGGGGVIHTVPWKVNLTAVTRQVTYASTQSLDPGPRHWFRDPCTRTKLSGPRPASTHSGHSMQKILSPPPPAPSQPSPSSLPPKRGT